MELLKIKKMKPSLDNLYKIGRVGYELSGNDYFIYVKSNFMGQMPFFEYFYSVRNEVLEEAKKHDFFKYNLVNFQGHKIPCLYNSL